VQASVLSLLVVMIFMLFYYECLVETLCCADLELGHSAGRAGCVRSFLTLPGIAGVILTIAWA